MFRGAGPAGTAVVARRPDRVLLRVDDARAGTADPVPIAAIVLLRRSDDEVRLEPVERVRALPDLYALSFRIGGSEAAAESFSRVSRLAARTTIWNLYRPLRIETLETVVDRIAAAPFLSAGR